jgi:signal transduction histidine kinase
MGDPGREQIEEVLTQASRHTEELLQRTRESEHRFRERLTALIEVSNTLSKLDSFDELCRRAIELGRSRLGFDRLGLWFIVEPHGAKAVGSFGTDEQGNVRDERGTVLSVPPDMQEAVKTFDPATAVRVENTELYDGAGRPVGTGTLVWTWLWDGSRNLGSLCMDNLIRRERVTDDDRELLVLYASALGHLCSRLKAMEALRTAHTDLEKRIRDRTADLADANRRLTEEIAERHRAEERGRQHEGQLAQMSRLSSLGEMAAGIAHELNQPLAAIASYAEGCIRRLRSAKTEPGDLLEIMGRITSQAQRAGEIIHSVRHFLHKQEPMRSPIAAAELVRNTNHLLALDAKMNQVTLNIDIARDLPRVLADALQIEQVILNLAHNAFEAMQDTEAGQRILRIQVLPAAKNMIEFSIGDTGAGLSAGAAERLFEPFFTTKPQGLGLGLSISRSIIEAHQGRLWATPNRDRGVTFRFTLPAAGENE